MTNTTETSTLTIDFTGKVNSLSQISSYDDQLKDEIREKASKDISTFVVIDTGYAGHFDKPVIVSDHLNLTGTNPLVGPNNPIGERFPVVNDIYLDTKQANDCLSGVQVADNLESQKVAAGVKPGVVPTDSEIALINKLGGDFYCYNLVPTALIIAHAKKKLVGVILPPKMKPVENLAQLLGGAL